MKAQSTGKRIRLTDRDLLWFSKIHEHGPLSTSELLAFSDDGTQNKGRAQNRLTDLFNEDNNAHEKPYLLRPPQQFQTIDARYNELVYSLSPTAEQALKDAGTWSDWVHKAGGPFWHQRETAAFMAGVELECLNDPKHNFIPASQILERAQTTLRYPTTYTDPYTGQRLVKDLIPDGLFGIEFVREDGKFYRFHCVEIDRGTEPKTSPNKERKSLERMVLQYEDYIGNKRYQEHLKLRAPMVCQFKGYKKFPVELERRKTNLNLFREVGNLKFAEY